MNDVKMITPNESRRSALQIYADQRASETGEPALSSYLLCLTHGIAADRKHGVLRVSQSWPALKKVQKIARVEHVLNVCIEMYEQGCLEPWLICRFNEFDPTILSRLKVSGSGAPRSVEHMMPLLWGLFSGPLTERRVSAN